MTKSRAQSGYWYLLFTLVILTLNRRLFFFYLLEVVISFGFVLEVVISFGFVSLPKKDGTLEILDKGKSSPRNRPWSPTKGRRVIALLFLELRRDVGGGVGWSTSRPDRFTPRGRPGTNCTEGRVWPQGRSGPVQKNLVPPTGIRSPDRPSPSESSDVRVKVYVAGYTIDF